MIPLAEELIQKAIRDIQTATPSVVRKALKDKVFREGSTVEIKMGEVLIIVHEPPRPPQSWLRKTIREWLFEGS